MFGFLAIAGASVEYYRFQRGSPVHYIDPYAINSFNKQTVLEPGTLRPHSSGV